MFTEQEIRKLAKKYSSRLKNKIAGRITEMEGEDCSHFLIYQVLGITHEEGKLIDIYSNIPSHLYQ